MKIVVKNSNLEYRHEVEYNGELFIRKEYMSPKSFAWASEPDTLRDSHTIRWNISGDDEIYEYYSCDHGWSGPDGHLNPKWPIPEIELEFKKTVGKDLYYFDNIETPKEK